MPTVCPVLVVAEALEKVEGTYSGNVANPPSTVGSSRIHSALWPHRVP